jgi:hypothetical protein
MTDPSDEQCAELVAVQANRVRLVVEPGTAHMDRRRMFDQAFPPGVAVEARDRAQSTGDGRTSPPAGLELAAEALDVHAMHFEEPALMLRAPDNELSQVERVRLAGRTSIARQEPSERQLFTISEAPIDRNQSSRSTQIHRGPPIRGGGPSRSNGLPADPVGARRCGRPAPRRSAVPCSSDGSVHPFVLCARTVRVREIQIGSSFRFASPWA